MSNLEFLLREESLLNTFPEEELRQKGIDDETLEELRDDPHQSHPNKKDGYLGSLVANFLTRKGAISLNGDRESHVSAFMFTDYLKMDIGTVMEITHEESPIVVERNFDGDSDLFISIKDLHLVNIQFDDSSLTSLASHYLATGNMEVRERLAEEAQFLVASIAKNMYYKISGKVILDELVSDGNFGLFEAIENYDSSRNVKFEAYAAHRIRGSILDALRDRDRSKITRLNRERGKKITEFEKRFIEENESAPSVDDYLGEWNKLGYPSESFGNFYYNVYLRGLGKMVSLNENITMRGERGKVAELWQSVPSKDSPDPLEQTQSKEFMEIFERDLLVIPDENHRKALKRYLVDRATLAEAAEEVGLSESRLSQLKTLYVESGAFFRRTFEYIGGKSTIKLRLKK